MDNSEQYIKKCEKAVAIQENYKPNHGDWVYYNNMTDPEEMVVCAGDEWQNDQLRPWISYGTTYKESDTPTVYLPRQDQLQEIVIPKFSSQFEMMYAFWKYYNKYPNKQSLESYWLDFVMEKLYEKRWNGEDWI